MKSSSPTVPRFTLDEANARIAELERENAKLQRTAAREAWIKRFQGYFGDPLRLSEYRAGTLTFRELYESALRHADDQVNEAGHYDPAADLDQP